MKRVLSVLLSICLVLVFLAPPPAIAADDGIKIAAFTFDDGPSKTITPKLLDALAERGVPVTFFVNGKNAEAYPDIVLRAASEGHQIANHTYSHANLAKLSSEQVLYEVSRTQDYLSELLGEDEYLVRVPYGGINDRVKSLIKVPIIMWSVDPTSGKRMSASAMRSGIVKTAHDGAIILLHDTSTANLEAAIGAIDDLLAKGYVFVTLDELFELKNFTPAAGTVYYNVKGTTQGLFDESRLPTHWAYPSIQTMMETGIMVGDEGGFRPNSGITRAEAVAILWRMCGEVPSYVDLPFRDVEKGSWYESAVQWAYENEVVHGMTETSFAPQGKVTREQFYKMFEGFLEMNGYEAPMGLYELDYRDANAIGDWAWDSIGAIEARGFVSANAKERFYPKLGLTRAEAAEMCAWVLGLDTTF